MTDWATVSSLATASGTLVLALATFASVRSSNRAARATERALLAGIRPLIVASRLQDPPEKIGFGDSHWLRVEGGHAGGEATDEVVYLGMALRNAGSGLALLDRWDFSAEHETGDRPHRDPEQFRRLTRDIYISPGDLGFWQGAFRDPTEPEFASVHRAVADHQPLTIDLLYGDLEGGQRTISRFLFAPVQDDQWLATVVRHWNLDAADPR